MHPPRQGTNDVELVQGNSNGPIIPATTQPPAEPLPTPASDAPYGGFKHAFARNNPVPMFDNLRTTLTLLVILYNSILEVVANNPDQNENTNPIQFLVLSNFVGLYRNFVIGLFFFVSGFGSMLSLNIYNKSVPLFVFHRSINGVVLCLYAVAAPFLVLYVFGRKPNTLPGPGQSYYASQKGQATLLIGPICYIAVVFCFDLSYALFRLFRNTVGVQRSRTRYLFWVSVAFIALASWSIMAAGGHAPSIASIYKKYDVPIHDFHFPMQYIIGYVTGIFLPSVYAVYLPKTPARRAIPTFLFRLLFLSGTFTCLYLLSPDMKDQLQYANPRMPPAYMNYTNLPKPAGISKPVIIYALWSTLVYFFMTHSFHLLFLSEATESAVQGLKRKWGFVSRYSRSQAYNNIFFVIFFARHVQWIGPLLLKCAVVWVASTVSGYVLAAVGEFIWNKFVGWAPRSEETGSISKAQLIRVIWNHINGTVDENSVERFKTLLGEPKASNSVEMGTEINASSGLEESLSLTGESITENFLLAELTVPDEIGEVPESPHSTLQVHSEPEEETVKARSHNIDNLRMIVIILVVFRYAIVQVLINAPEQTEATAPIQFTILKYFVDLNRTIAVPMLYFISGMWSTHTMETQKGSRSRFLQIKAVRTIFLVIAYFNGTKLIRYIYVAWPGGSNTSSVIPLKDNGFLLTDGSMFYVLLLFIFDLIYALKAKNPNGSSTTTAGSGFEVSLGQYVYAQYFCTGLSRIVTAISLYLLTCIWKGDTSFYYFDPQFLSLYAVAYYSGIHFSSTMVYTFLSANVLDGKPILTLILRTLFSAYCIHFGLDVHIFTSLRTPSTIDCPSWLTIIIYAFFVSTAFFLVGPSILLLFFQKPALMRSWGLFSRVTLVQPVLQTFLVIGLARRTGWIGNIMARCVFVGVSSVVCGWVVAIIPLVVWRLVVNARTRRRRYMPLDSGVSA